MFTIGRELMEKVEHIATSDKEERFSRVKELINRPFRIEGDQDEYVRNIIIPSKEEVDKVVLTAHWDNYPGSTGLNDNATGIAILMQIQDQLPANVEIVFTDLEESGGIGSAHYIKNHKNEIKCNINLDVCGIGQFIYLDRYANADFIIPEDEYIIDTERIPFNDSYIFAEFGVPSMLIMAGNGGYDFLSEIFEHQHCNAGDGDMDSINPDSLMWVYEFLQNLLDYNKTA